MTALVPTYNFVVRLTRTTAPVSTLQAPPNLRSANQGPAQASAPGRRRAPRPAPAARRSTGSQVLGDGGFQECTGLDLEAEIREYVEGGRSDGVVRGAGRAKLVPIVLKRGMLVAAGPNGTALWDWLRGMVEGTLPLPRYDGTVEALGPVAGTGGDRPVAARWTFDSGLPSRVTGPAFNAAGGTFGLEELHIVHEGLRLESQEQRS